MSSTNNISDDHTSPHCTSIPRSTSVKASAASVDNAPSNKPYRPILLEGNLATEALICRHVLSRFLYANLSHDRAKLVHKTI